MSKIINWGIMGCGKIAHSFAKGLSVLPEATLYAAGSRTKEKAVSFGQKYNILKTYGSYDELATDPHIDIIYIATPHNYHKENTLLCLRNYKAVLCEKPMCINAKEAEELIKEARKNQLFLMEAMWMRFLPVMFKVREWLNEKIIGDIRILKADFGFRFPWEPQKRILNINLAGGALLDVGIYTLSLAYMVFKNEPVKITSTAYIGETGVDEQSAYLLSYGNGAFASLTSAVRTKTPHDAIIIGTKGSIVIPDFWHGQMAILHIKDKAPSEFKFPFISNGYNYEAQYTMDCLKKNKLESDIMPLNETLLIIKTMDEIRSQWKLIYPEEK